MTGFLEALGRAGQTARVVSWAGFLDDPDSLTRGTSEPAILRIEAFGEDIGVAQRLLKLGAAWARREGVWVATDAELAALPQRYGAILAPRQLHMGFETILYDISETVGPPSWTLLTPPSTISLCFDKRRTADFFRTLGIPVPRTIDLDRDEYPNGAMVKLASGSSASCLGIYRRGKSGPSFFTTMEQTETGLYNSLRTRTYRGEPPESLVRLLRREGAHIEEFIPKASIEGQNFDLRILLVGGEPAFTVVRSSPQPITNLHLGGTRGDPARLPDVVPAHVLAGIDAAMRTIGTALPALHLGVDVLIEAHPEPGSPGFRVLELNAFGDLLPGLTRRAPDDGGVSRDWSVYDWEIRAALAQYARSARRGSGY